MHDDTGPHPPNQLPLFENSKANCKHCAGPIPPFANRRYCTKECRMAYYRKMRESRQDEVPTSVYKYYDRDGILIYVGITSRGSARNTEHNKSKFWWKFVDRQTVEHYLSRLKADRREQSLIQKMAPPFNRQHNRDYKAAQDAYLIRRQLGGSEGIEKLIKGRNRVAGVVVNIVGNRVTIAVPDPRITFNETSQLRFDGRGRKATLLDTGVFADGSASWLRVKVSDDAHNVTGAIIMYRFDNEYTWTPKVVELVFGDRTI